MGLVNRAVVTSRGVGCQNWTGSVGCSWPFTVPVLSPRPSHADGKGHVWGFSVRIFWSVGGNMQILRYGVPVVFELQGRKVISQIHNTARRNQASGPVLSGTPFVSVTKLLEEDISVGRFLQKCLCRATRKCACRSTAGSCDSEVAIMLRSGRLCSVFSCVVIIDYVFRMGTVRIFFFFQGVCMLKICLHTYFDNFLRIVFTFLLTKLLKRFCNEERVFL